MCERLGNTVSPQRVLSRCEAQRYVEYDQDHTNLTVSVDVGAHSLGATCEYYIMHAVGWGWDLSWLSERDCWALHLSRRVQQLVGSWSP